MKTSSEFLKNPDRVKALKKRRNDGRTWEQLEKEFKLKPTRGMAAYRVYNANGTTKAKATTKPKAAAAKKPTVVAKPKAKPSAKPAVVAPVAKAPAPELPGGAPAISTPAPTTPVAATPAPVAAPAPAPVVTPPVAAKAPPPRKSLEDLAARLTTLEFHGQEQADPKVEIGTENVARSFRVPSFFAASPDKKDDDWPAFSGAKEAKVRAEIHFQGMSADVAVVDDEKSWFTVRVAPK